MKAQRPRSRPIKPTRKKTIIRRISGWVQRVLTSVEDGGWQSAGGVVVNREREVALTLRLELGKVGEVASALWSLSSVW